MHRAGVVQVNIERASSRMALSMVALGLYISVSLLMQHSIGPRMFGFPVLAALGYFLAGWLTLRVVKGTGKGRAPRRNLRRAAQAW